MISGHPGHLSFKDLGRVCLGFGERCRVVPLHLHPLRLIGQGLLRYLTITLH